MRVTYYVGNRHHKVTLGWLAAAVVAIGPHGSAGISELVGRIADAADYDLQQTATILAAIQQTIVPAALVVGESGGAERSVNVYLGAAEAERRRAALARLAGRLDASISRVLWWMAVVAEANPERAIAQVSEIMNLAAQSYVLAAEAMQQDAALRVTAGKYATERAARAAADLTTNPVVVRCADGSYDWLPYGAAVAEEHQITARHIAGRGWKATDR